MYFWGALLVTKYKHNDYDDDDDDNNNKFVVVIILIIAAIVLSITIFQRTSYFSEV